MKVSLIFRVIIRPSGRVLRVRIRREDGLSIILLFSDPGRFEAVAQQANLSPMALQAIGDDVAVLEQMSESSFTRADLEISQEELQSLCGAAFREPQEFNLRVERIGGGNELRVTAREVDPLPGLMSLNVHAVIPKEEFQHFLSRVNLHPSQIRDAHVYGSKSGRRITEDEVETLFDLITH
ncbi:MAG: hypothetical protein H0X25_09185 [Acidobacteriales bacterium]|nr:hypothetical protein [Terriglobales bacterium]